MLFLTRIMKIIDSFDRKRRIRRPRAGFPSTRFTVGHWLFPLNFSSFLTVLSIIDSFDSFKPVYP